MGKKELSEAQLLPLLNMAVAANLGVFCDSQAYVETVGVSCGKEEGKR